ncbi:MAG: response regulator [Spirochaetes bacterium]|nr:response regulator [Spirochaetota bacterium]
MSDKKKVLIVDDSGYMRQVIRRHLESKGFEISGEASDGSEVVALAESLKPDLITMDLSMKNLGGIEATKLVKQAAPETKVIVVSALGESRFIKEAVAAGAHDFIIKPFTEDRLISSVKSALKMA